MGDLFDDYDKPFANPRKREGQPWDEMFEGAGAPRASYKPLHDALSELTKDDLRERDHALASAPCCPPEAL